MNSKDLPKGKFKEWLQFCLKSEQSIMNKLPSETGVYVVRSSKPFGRFIGDPDIVYIGSAKNRGGLKTRVKQFFHPGPTQTTNLRVQKLIERRSDLHLGFTVDERPRNLENDLLSLVTKKIILSCHRRTDKVKACL